WAGPLGGGLLRLVRGRNPRLRGERDRGDRRRPAARGLSPRREALGAAAPGLRARLLAGGQRSPGLVPVRGVAPSALSRRAACPPRPARATVARHRRAVAGRRHRHAINYWVHWIIFPRQRAFLALRPFG